jgi:hypothetical protein
VTTNIHNGGIRRVVVLWENNDDEEMPLLHKTPGDGGGASPKQRLHKKALGEKNK